MTSPGRCPAPVARCTAAPNRTHERPGAAFLPQVGATAAIHDLQRTAGNRAVQDLLGRQVLMSPSERAVQPVGSGTTTEVLVDPSASTSAPGSGRMPADIRTLMERRFAVSFTGVRIHADAAANRAAADLGAVAFTQQEHIFFASGTYRPRTAAGRWLLAHELTHVVQQRLGRFPASANPGRAAAARRPLEDEADRMARDVAGGPLEVRQPAMGSEILRSPNLQEQVAGLVSKGGFLAAADLVVASLGDLVDPLIAEAQSLRQQLQGVPELWFDLETAAEMEAIWQKLRGLAPTWLPVPDVHLVGPPSQQLAQAIPIAVILLLIILAMIILLRRGPGPSPADYEEAGRQIREFFNRLRRGSRGPKRQPEKEPKKEPEKEPKPGEDFPPWPIGEEKPRGPRCRRFWGPPAGGDRIHDEYSRFVAERYGDPTYATLNYWVEEDGLVADFDHYLAGGNEFFEVKTRHEILLREWARSQPEILARLLLQAQRQFEVLRRCARPGWRLVWFFDDQQVAAAAQDYLGGIVDEVRHAPWPGGQRPTE